MLSAPQKQSRDQTQLQETQYEGESLDDVRISVNESEILDGEPVEPEECLYANSAVNIVNFEGYVMRRMADMKTFLKEYEVSLT